MNFADFKEEARRRLTVLEDEHLDEEDYAMSAWMEELSSPNFDSDRLAPQPAACRK